MAKAKSKAAPRAPHGTGVGKLMSDLLMKGKTNEQVLSAIKGKFPKAKTNLACVSWMRTKLRGEGAKVKTNRELTTKAA